jgi:hypothetical protein
MRKIYFQTLMYTFQNLCPYISHWGYLGGLPLSILHFRCLVVSPLGRRFPSLLHLRFLPRPGELMPPTPGLGEQLLGVKPAPAAGAPFHVWWELEAAALATGLHFVGVNQTARCRRAYASETEEGGAGLEIKATKIQQTKRNPLPTPHFTPRPSSALTWPSSRPALPSGPSSSPPHP